MFHTFQIINSHFLIQILKYIVLAICLVVTTYQVTICFQKLKHPPISTHSKVVINETMTYPALTICRYPAFKADVLKNYGLLNTITNPKTWSSFDFNSTSLEQVWKESTYNVSETIQSIQIANDRTGKYYKVLSKYYFFNGQCHTIIPLATTKSVNRLTGIMLILKTDRTNSSEDSGWNIYVHDTLHPWIENTLQTEEVVENYFLETGNDYYFKLSASGYKLLNSENHPCSHNDAESRNDCREICRWQHIVRIVGCSAPWLYDLDMPIIKYPATGEKIKIKSTSHCTTFPQFSNLVNFYKNFSNLKPFKQTCSCPYPCLMRLYQMYPVKHNDMVFKDNFNSYSKLSLYFTSKIVNSIEEVVTYDYSNFLSDLGGSLGFLLGLSVLGVIDLMEQSVKYVNRNIKKDYLPKEDKTSSEEAHDRSTSSLKIISCDNEYVEFWDNSLWKKL